MEYQMEQPYKYGEPVMISHWQDRFLSHPHDNPNTKNTGVSHYRSFGERDFVYIPKTTTQDQYDSVVNYKSDSVVNFKREMAAPRSIINFESYPMSDMRFKKHMKRQVVNAEELVEPLTTTYRSVFTLPRPLIQEKDCCLGILDPLFNRIPVSDFEMLPGAESKYMDDHISHISPGKRKINYFRRIRNSTYLFKK